jgi:hypothetical protein
MNLRAIASLAQRRARQCNPPIQLGGRNMPVHFFKMQSHLISIFRILHHRNEIEVNMARDRYHRIVRSALEAEGWVITDDPLIIETLKRDLEVDLGAERLIAAEKGLEKIAVEIKSFLGLSQIHDFYKALGQFNYYSLALEEQEPDRSLFLAIPAAVYESVFKEPITLKAIERFKLKIIVYHIQQEKIVLWKK